MVETKLFVDGCAELLPPVVDFSVAELDEVGAEVGGSGVGNRMEKRRGQNLLLQ